MHLGQGLWRRTRVVRVGLAQVVSLPGDANVDRGLEDGTLSPQEMIILYVCWAIFDLASRSWSKRRYKTLRHVWVASTASAFWVYHDAFNYITARDSDTCFSIALLAQVPHAFRQVGIPGQK